MHAPAGPHNTMAYRAAKLAVIVLSALIILGLIGLVVGVGLKITGHSVHLFGGGADSGGDTAAPQAFFLPPGGKIVSSETQPGRLILHVHAADGDEIDIVSVDDGHLIARIKSAPAR
jgi:hypothetical protein